jgi:U3 small nucleolar RNA-associated protein 6
MNPENIDMWREYVRMELGFIESLRRRWEVLGISLTNAGTKGKSRKGKGKANEEIDPSEHISAGELEGEELGGKMEIDTEASDLDNGDEGMAARRQIMEGAIVKSVMTSAAEGMLCLLLILPYICIWPSMH